MSETCSTQQEEECTPQQILKDTLENPFEFAQEQFNLMKNRILKLEQEVQTLKTTVSKQILEASSAADIETVEMDVELSFEEVKEKVLEYINMHERFRTSDILFDLCIAPELVIEALEALEAENKVESRDIPTPQKQ